jgi:lysophospholipase L1-like esterase
MFRGARTLADNMGRRAGGGGGAALPPLPAGARIVSLGDSVQQYANDFATIPERRAVGELWWALAVSPRARQSNWADATAVAANLVPTYAEGAAAGPFFRGGNLGMAGDTATGTGRRMAQVNAISGPKCVWIAAGTNLGAGDSEAVVISELTARMNAVRANGDWPIITTIRPREVSLTPIAPQIGAAHRDRNVNINAWIRANHASFGAALHDPWESMRDRSFNPGDALFGTVAPGMTYDGVHLTQLGAYTSALSTSFGAVPLVDAINRTFQPGFAFDPDPTVANLLVNGRFTGTTGTVGAGFTGVMPASTTIQNLQGTGRAITGTVAMEPNTETGGQSILVTVNSNGSEGANAFNTVRFAHTNVTTGYTSSDYVQAIYEFEMISDPNKIFQARQITVGQGTGIAARGFGVRTTLYNNDPIPSNAHNLWKTSEPLLCGSLTSVNPRLQLDFRADVAGTAQFRVRRGILRIVPSPVTDFPWVP